MSLCGVGLGFAPRRRRAGVAGVALSPGLAAVAGRAGAAVPFAGAAGLLAGLAGVRLAAGRVRHLAALGDGAARIRGIASSKFPSGATQVVGLCPARGHLRDLARLLELMPGAGKKHGSPPGWKAPAAAAPAASAQRPVPASSPASKRNGLGAVLGCFEGSAARVRCDWFRRCGLPAGSGVAESGCWPVIGQRLRLSGMHGPAAAGAVTALCCWQAGRPEGRVWVPPRRQVPAAWPAGSAQRSC